MVLCDLSALRLFFLFLFFFLAGDQTAYPWNKRRRAAGFVAPPPPWLRFSFLRTLVGFWGIGERQAWESPNTPLSRVWSRDAIFLGYLKSALRRYISQFYLFNHLTDHPPHNTNRKNSTLFATLNKNFQKEIQCCLKKTSHIIWIFIPDTSQVASGKHFSAHVYYYLFFSK